MSQLSYDNRAYVHGGTYPPPTSEAPTPAVKARWTGCQVTWVVVGALLVVGGVAFMAGGYQALYDSIFQNKMEVVPGSTSYDIWRTTPVPIFIRFFIFNLTNPDEFQAGEKAVLQELGPYVYQEYHEKQNISYHDNSTVTYYQQRWWLWDQEMSGNNSLDDVVISLNTVLVSAAWTVHNSPPLVLSGLNFVVDLVNETLFFNSTVGELIFDGIEDPLLDWMSENVVVNGTVNPNLPFELPPGLTQYDKFGWFYKRNLSLTYDGLFNMFTGQDTLDHIGVIDWWNKANTTDFFDYPCNMVKGSAGELWPPDLQKDYIELYSSDLCMTMRLYYKEEVEDSHGLPGYRYWGSNLTFVNQSVIPENSCYCVKETCAPNGLLNAESCRMGAPAFISFPHFLHADPQVMEGVEGLDPPDEDLDAFVIDIIPETGTPMWVTARMQINMHVIPYPGQGLAHTGRIELLKDVQEVYLPMLWFEELAALPDDLADDIGMLLFILHTPTVTIIFSLMIGGGALLLLAAVLTHYRKSNKIRNV